MDFKPIFVKVMPLGLRLTITWFILSWLGLVFRLFSGHGMFKQEACDLSFQKDQRWHIDTYLMLPGICLYVFQEKTLQNVPVKWTEWQQGCQRVDEGVCSYPSSVTIISLMPPSWTPDRSVIWWAAGIPFSDAFQHARKCFVHSSSCTEHKPKHTHVQTQDYK